MLEVQAAIGRIQLRKLAVWSMQRAANAAALRDACQFPAVRVPAFKCSAARCGVDCPSLSRCAHANYKFYVFVEAENLAEEWSRDRIVAELYARGVPCYQGTCSEVYLERAFDGTNLRPSVRLLVHPTLTEEDMAHATRELKSILHAASR
jgi:dTDP-4-amino-4,6-dideoxygalactose transaminase